MIDRWRRLETPDKLAVIAIVQWPIVVLAGMVLTWTGVVR